MLKNVIKNIICSYKSQSTLLSHFFKVIYSPHQVSALGPPGNSQHPPDPLPLLHFSHLHQVERPTTFHNYFPKSIRLDPTSDL